MRKSIVAAAVLLCAIACTQAFGQISNATVTGTIEDATHAVLPGVSITSTNTATGVTTTAVSNEAGTYNLPSLLPGPYKISAELAGFQIRSYDVTLGNAQTVRLNFTLAVAGVGTAVEVSVAVDTLLGIAAFLMPDDHDFIAVIAGHTADNGGIIAKGTITVNFTPAGKKTLHIIKSERTLGMARQFSLLPRIDVDADLLAQKIDLVLEVLELEMSFLVLPCLGLKLGNLLFYRFQLPLRFNRWIQK